jgi:hypothetical protein
MANVTGRLESALNEEAVAGKVEVMLCGYGSRVPRINGEALVARITDDDIEIDGEGEFNFTVPFNDEISPAGTYYAITIKDENGDIAQVNAYRFTSDKPSYDLNLIDPYDPNQPPPPLPPLITNQLLLVAAENGMIFPGDTYTAFKTTLSGDVDFFTVEDMIPGNLYTFIIVQDATGNWLFVWPANVHNAVPVDPEPNSTTIQTFVADETGQLWAIGPGTWS